MSGSAVQAAVYARVSSERHAEAQTIRSHVAALYERAAHDGLDLPPERAFIDDGYRGSTLIRPALERLCDLVASGGLDRLYVYAPDRLAHRYAYQVLLLEEFAQAGVEVVFLNHAVGASPEDKLLLQVPGWSPHTSVRCSKSAAAGASAMPRVVGPSASAPRRPTGIGTSARRRVRSHRAMRWPLRKRVVRQVFAWVAYDRWTLGAIARQLQQEGVRMASGKPHWSRSALATMLKNPTYTGRAVYGRTRSGPWQPPLRPRRGHGPIPRVPMTPLPVPNTEWVTIPVPALVDEATFLAVQERLEENRQRVRQHLGAASSKRLLAGRLVCARCGDSYYFSYCRETRRQTVREYQY